MSPASELHHDTPVRFLLRNFWLITGIAACVIVWAAVYAFTFHKLSYAAHSMVIIKDSALTTRYVVPEQYYALQTTSSNSSNPVLNTMGLLKSSAISNALWEYFLEKHPEELRKNKISNKTEWDKFFMDGSKFIKAKNQPGTDLIAVDFAWDDPVIAKEALDVVVTTFRQASLDLNRSEQKSRIEFLEGQVADMESKLLAVRARKTAFRQQTGTVSTDKESTDLAGTRMDLATKLNELEAAARGREAEVARYKEMLGMDPAKALKASAIGQNGTMAKLQDQLYEYSERYAHLRATLTENNPKVKELKAQIEQIKADIETEKVRTLGKDASLDGGIVADTTRGTVVSNMVEAQAEAQRLRSEASIIRRRLGEVNTLIQRFPKVQAELANIEQEEASFSKALDNLREKAMEARLKEEQTVSNVFIVDPPHLPVKPQFPTQLHIMVLSVVLGFGAGLVTAMAKEQFVGQSGEVTLPEWLEALVMEEEVNEQPAIVPVAAHDTGEPTGDPYKEMIAASIPLAGPLAHADDNPAISTPPRVVTLRQKITRSARNQAPANSPAFNQAYQRYQPMSEPVELKKRPQTKPEPQKAVNAEVVLPAPVLEAPRNPAPEPAPTDPMPMGYEPPAQPVDLEWEAAPTGTASGAASKTHLNPQDDLMADLDPLPVEKPTRRPRGIPSFLLADDAPATAGSQKTHLAPGEDLMTDVAPLPGPYQPTQYPVMPDRLYGSLRDNFPAGGPPVGSLQRRMAELASRR